MRRLQIDKAACDIEPVFGDGLEGLILILKSAHRKPRSKGGFDPDELAAGQGRGARARQGACSAKHRLRFFCIWAARGCATLRLRGAAENLALVASRWMRVLRLSAAPASFTNLVDLKGPAN